MQKRRRYFLRGTDQPTLLGTLLGIWLLSTIAAGLLLYFGANRSLEDATYRAHFEAMRETSQVFVPYLLVSNLVAAVAILALGVFYTHRVAGPIYQIEKRLAQLRDGDLGVTFAVRRRDRFRTLVDRLNEAIGAVRQRWGRTQTAVARLRELRAASAASGADWDEALRELDDALKELKT